MVGKYSNHNPDQNRSPNPAQNLCKPLKHTNKKVCDEGTNQPIKHNKEAFDQREKGYLTYIIKGLRILGANQQNDIITSEYLEEVHHLQYPSHAFTVLTARSEEECVRYSRTSINSLRSLISVEQE